MPFPALLLWGAGAVVAGAVANKAVKAATGKSLVDRTLDSMEKFSDDEDRKRCYQIKNWYSKFKFYDYDEIRKKILSLVICGMDSLLLKSHLESNYNFQGDEVDAKIKGKIINIALLIQLASLDQDRTRKFFKEHRGDIHRLLDRLYLESCLNKHANDDDNFFQLAANLNSTLKLGAKIKN